MNRYFVSYEVLLYKNYKTKLEHRYEQCIGLSGDYVEKQGKIKKINFFLSNMTDGPTVQVSELLKCEP